MINPTCVDVILGFLAKDEYLDLVHELEYLKIYLLCLAKWNDSVFGKEKSFGFLEESHIEAKLEEAEREIKEFRFEGFEAVVCELLDRIEICKPKIEEDCLNFLDCSFECNFSIDELPHFMGSISASLRNLVHLKDQIESLQHNLQLFNELVDFAARRCSRHEYLRDFQIHIQAWACRAACISLLCWAVPDAKKQGMMAPRINIILSDLRMKISPSTPEVTRMYLSVLLKASKPSSAKDSFTANKLVLKFVEFLKDNLQVDPEQDGIQMLFVDLVFLITFLMDPPETQNLIVDGNFVATRAETVVHEAATLISSLCSGEIKQAFSEEESDLLLHNFLDKAAAIKVEVRRIFAHLFFDPSSLNFPKINALGHFDSLLEDLNKFCYHFPNHQMRMLHDELLSLKELNTKYFFSILESQNKNNDIKDLCTRIVNLAYSAERAAGSFIYMKRSLWHDILCFSDILAEVKVITSEVKNIHEKHMNGIHALSSEPSRNAPLPVQTNIPTVGKVVAFKDRAREIQDRLLWGSSELDIISIVGMAGSGKTTLAKKVYNDPSIRSRFHKYAWCTVSQIVNRKRILLDILIDVTIDGASLSNMKEEDLEEILYRSLKGQKYFIIMDDIWSVDAWKSLKNSFPDENIGSRIIFTSRIQVISEAICGSSPFVLNPLSSDESWELLEKKLFYKGSCCPSNFVGIGKQIASNCKGLPLSVDLIASILREKIEDLDWWKEVGNNLNSFIVKTGCMDIFELSYKHLPEFLKPCFLYIGLFPKDEDIRVNKLSQLWISEGFIKQHETENVEILAKQYLMDLVARSLVTVTKRSSTGGIKTCVVHDLLRDFCIAKGEEAKVYKMIPGNKDSDLASTSSILNSPDALHYRASIGFECWRSFLQHVPPASFLRSLLSLHPFSIKSGSSEAESFQYLAFSYFKFLHVLYLDRNLVVDEFPDGITELVLLRYLTLACNSESIPPSINKLENLEALHLQSSKLFSLKWPSYTWKLSDVTVFDLPLTVWEMRKLRHVDVTTVQIPCDFCDGLPPLENVQAFSSLVLCYEDAETFFRTIPKVRKLKCLFHLSGAPRSGNQIVKFDFLSQLESLFMRHLDSTRLKLRSCAFHLPETLKKLTLMDFKQPWSAIKAIAKLPNLEVVKLSDAFCGKTWGVGDEDFPNLKFLRLHMINIRDWEASDEAFPRLEHLEVDYCRKLEAIPYRFGSILTLKVIEVVKCRTTIRESLDGIMEDQENAGNEHFQVFISRAIKEDYSSVSDSDSDP